MPALALQNPAAAGENTNTNRWQFEYQAMVASVPTVGRPRTKPWYFEYQRLVFHLSLGGKPYIYLSLPTNKA